MQTTISKKQIANRTNQIIEALLHEPELNDLSNEQLEQIAKSVVIDNLKEKLKKEVAKIKISKSLNKLKTRWLNKFDSAHTKRSFEKNIQIFLNWLESKSLAEVDAQVADDYVAYLKNSKVGKNKGKSKEGDNISDNTILQRIAACSSFFKDLVRWQILPVNPFLGVKRPRKELEIKKSDDIPTDKELDKIEKLAFHAMTDKIENHKTNTERKNKAGKMAYAALKILRHTGLRVGSLSTLEIDSNGHYTAKSKGSTASGQLDKMTLHTLYELELNKKRPFKNYRHTAFSMWLHRKTNGQFMPHSIRHKFSVDYYNRTKDILGLSRALGHKTTIPTQAYLASLKTELKMK